MARCCACQCNSYHLLISIVFYVKHENLSLNSKKDGNHYEAVTTPSLEVEGPRLRKPNINFPVDVFSKDSLNKNNKFCVNKAVRTFSKHNFKVPTECVYKLAQDNFVSASCPEYKFKFMLLVNSLNLVQLPGVNWKIQLAAKKMHQVTEITFTNREKYARIVKFSLKSKQVVITFADSVVNLLGAPALIQSVEDVSILLCIIHCIKIDDPVLEFT